jgi:hypothetical protein
MAAASRHRSSCTCGAAHCRRNSGRPARRNPSRSRRRRSAPHAGRIAFRTEPLEAVDIAGPALALQHQHEGIGREARRMRHAGRREDGRALGDHRDLLRAGRPARDAARRATAQSREHLRPNARIRESRPAGRRGRGAVHPAAKPAPALSRRRAARHSGRPACRSAERYRSISAGSAKGSSRRAWRSVYCGFLRSAAATCARASSIRPSST